MKHILLLISALSFSFIGTLVAQTKSSDTVFTTDMGFRITNGGIPSISYDAASGTYYLFYEGTQSAPGSKVATSKDGIIFGAPITQTNYAFDPRRVRLPNGKWRLYEWNMGLKQMKSKISSDGITFTEESGSRYALDASDKGTLGVYDIFIAPNGKMVMTYLGDLMGLNNMRRAVSSDSGATFVFDKGNILGDSALGGGANSYVDPRSTLLPDGRRRLFSMRQGWTIYSHISTDGYSYTLEPGVRLNKDAFAQYQAQSLNDPTVIRLPDGRYRMYVASNLNYGAGCCNYAIVSATTAMPTDVKTISETPEPLHIAPNPVTDQTTVRFSITKRERTTLKLYDVLGQEITLLLDAELEAGEHSLPFPVLNSQFSFGFLRLQTPTFTITKPVQAQR